MIHDLFNNILLVKVQTDNMQSRFGQYMVILGSLWMSLSLLGPRSHTD